ncbi:MAG: class I SAM-dependent methyltransferase [Tatlockia sp.]|nr:class I SAM-dependent methyltransferase [Tatlockia sp.]
MNNKSLNTYSDLCTQVYDLSKPAPPKDAYDFYLSYVKETQGAILEPMCGTGRYLLPMLAEGVQIEGFDASHAMLDALKIKAKNQNLSPQIWYGFIEELKQPKQYGLIFIPCGSFCLITDLQAIKKSLQTIYDHLEKDGLLVFEVETSHSLPKELGLWRGSRWLRADGKIILLSQLAMLEEAICYSIGKYELVEGNQIIQSEIEEYKIRIYNEPAFLLELLAKTGFNQIRLVKAFDRNCSPEESDESYIYECRK